jgi:Heterokaryon incompatibility protein (HET)
MARTTDRHLPTRLLYTGQGKSLGCIKLCDTAHLNPTVQYATLSHVWGTNPHFKLTSENVERFSQGVAITDLPQTFRHAVELTNSLSLQYLWIDALCILQNNKADWERESSAMAGIYSGAILNIAASAAIDSNGGLFTSRNPLDITPCVISVSNKALQWENEPCAVWIEDLGKRHIADAPLNKRAWVLQERLLAPRTVHFTPTKMFWECPEHLASETDPHGDFEKHTESSLTRGWIMPPPGYNVSINKQSNECLKKWNTAVELYSAGNLTYESDKLVAIAGVARHIHSLWPDPTIKYLAGLWSYNLVFSLLWYRLGPASSSSRPEQYRGPSWSWVAMNGDIRFFQTFDYSVEPLAFIVEERTSPTGDPFGAVNGGYIRVRGPLRVAFADGAYKQPQALIYPEPTGKGITLNQLYLDHGCLETVESNGLDIYCLLGVATYLQGTDDSRIQGLVLLPNRDHRGQYTRMGMFDTTMDEAGKLALFPLQRLYGAGQKFGPTESLYLESHDDNTFTIEII